MTTATPPRPVPSSLLLSPGHSGRRAGSDFQGKAVVRSYAADTDSRLDYVRCVIHAPAATATSPELLSASLQQVLVEDTSWSALAFRLGIASRARVLAGLPVLSLSCRCEHTPEVLDRLGEVLGETDWARLARAAPQAVERLGSRHSRMPPRAAARALCLAHFHEEHLASPAPDLLPGAGPQTQAEPRMDITVLLSGSPTEAIASGAGPGPSAPGPRARRLSAEMRTTGDGEQSWVAWGWDVPISGPECLAAGQLFLFAAAGAPSSRLFCLLRDRLGISYGPRSSLQPLTTSSARGWVEVCVPRAHEDTASTLLQTAMDEVAADLDHHLRRAAPAFRTAVLASLDAPSGAADAIVVGECLGDSTIVWRTAAALADPTRLVTRVPAPLLDAGLATQGRYRTGNRAQEGPR